MDGTTDLELKEWDEVWVKVYSRYYKGVIWKLEADRAKVRLRHDTGAYTTKWVDLPNITRELPDG